MIESPRGGCGTLFHHVVGHHRSWGGAGVAGVGGWVARGKRIASKPGLENEPRLVAQSMPRLTLIVRSGMSSGTRPRQVRIQPVLARSSARASTATAAPAVASPRSAHSQRRRRRVRRSNGCAVTEFVGGLSEIAVCDGRGREDAGGGASGTEGREHSAGSAPSPPMR